jgi:hypothetical protein
MTRFGISYVGHIGHVCLLGSLLIELFSRGLLPQDIRTFDNRWHPARDQ